MNKITSRKNLNNGYLQNEHSLNNNRSKFSKVEEYRSFKQKKSFGEHFSLVLFCVWYRYVLVLSFLGKSVHSSYLGPDVLFFSTHLSP